MLSVHLTGNPWFLLLLLPGLYILARQYLQGPIPSGPRYARHLLFFLQALALLVLTLSLTAPELRRTRVQFHNPAILILRDQSASFRNGQYLGLGESYSRFEKKLRETYQGRKFDIGVVDFHEGAWPVAGFPKPAKPVGSNSEDSLIGILTSLSAAADFVDSAAMQNLQGVFLFSDGRSNLDSGKSLTWSVPVFPVVFSADSIQEVQAEKISLALNSKSQAVEAVVRYRAVGSRSTSPTLTLIQFGKTLLQHKLPEVVGSREYRFTLPLDKSLFAEGHPVQAVLQPGISLMNFDPYNDTSSVTFSNGQSQSRIFVYKPIRSLDEKGMVEILAARESESMVFFSSDELAGLKLKVTDQVWIELETFTKVSPLRKFLESVPAKVVLYSRPGMEGSRQTPWASGPWQGFSPAAEIRVSQQAMEDFPDEVVRLKDLTRTSLAAPASLGRVQPLVEMLESGKRGVLMGRISLSEEKRALVFLLPEIWDELFDPQSDYATRANITAYIQSVKTLAVLDEETIRVTRPGRVFHLVPFNLEFQLPALLTRTEKPLTRTEKSTDNAPVTLNIIPASGRNKRELPMADSENSHEPKWRGMRLPQGKYQLALTKGEVVLWRDSLEVAPRINLELASIGFNAAALEDAATHSGGRVLVPDAGIAPRPESPGVTSVLPELPSAQTRMEKTHTYRLYNTSSIFFVLLLLLSGAWLLRKKWDLD